MFKTVAYIKIVYFRYNLFMKIFIIINLLLLQLYAARSCHVVLDEIKHLEDQKSQMFGAKFVTFLFASSYIVSPDNKETDIKIRLLKVELESCNAF